MRRSIASLIALSAALVFLVSCGDTSRRDADPTSPIQRGGGQLNTAPACVTLTNLVSMVNTVFGAGAPDANSALGKLDNLDKQLQKGNIGEAQEQARSLVSFIQLKAQQGTLPGTHAQIQALINGILCYAGLSADTFIVFPDDPAQILRHGSGRSGISLQANTVAQPTLI